MKVYCLFVDLCRDQDINKKLLAIYENKEDAFKEMQKLAIYSGGTYYVEPFKVRC